MAISIKCGNNLLYKMVSMTNIQFLGIKRPELKDELFMQLLKQTRGNPNQETRQKVWELFYLVASTMPPSKDYVSSISEYIHITSRDEHEPTTI